MRTWFSFLLFFVLFGCATATPYQPQVGKSEYGYQDLKIEDNKYRISFKGNASTTRETVETYLLYRAAELTIANGYDSFLVREQQVDVKSDYFTTGPTYGMYSGFGRRRYPYYAVGYSWAGPTSVSSSDMYRAVAYVTLLKGKEAVGKEEAYNAHEVIKNLGPKIVWPKDESKNKDEKK